MVLTTVYQDKNKVVIFKVWQHYVNWYYYQTFRIQWDYNRPVVASSHKFESLTLYTLYSWAGGRALNFCERTTRSTDSDKWTTQIHWFRQLNDTDPLIQICGMTEDPLIQICRTTQIHWFKYVNYTDPQKQVAFFILFSSHGKK